MGDSGYRLPGGDPAWFVRIRSGWSYNVVPCRTQGWLLTIGYALFEVIASLGIFELGADPPGAREWILFAIAVTVPTVIFMVATWRLSVPIGAGGPR